MPGKPRRGLTLRQKRLVEALTDPKMKHKSLSSAMRAAGYSANTIDRSAGKMANAPAVREAIERRKRPKSLVDKLMNDGAEMLQTAMTKAKRDDDHDLLARYGTAAMQAAKLLKDADLVRPDEEKDETRAKYYYWHLIRVCQKSTEWAMTRPACLERYVKALQRKMDSL